MKRKFDLRMLLLTLMLSSLGMLVCLPLRDNLGSSVPGRAAWCALWFALPLALGFIGVEAGLALNHKRFRPIRKRNFLAGLLAALLLGASIGGGGGMLCMLEFQTTAEITDPGGRDPAKIDPPETDPPETDPSETDPPESWGGAKHIVLLIDASDSVRSNDIADRLAACNVIDTLGGDVSAQAAVFAYAPTVEDVRYQTDYLPLEDGVKEQFKEFIQNTDIVGGTSFEGPIRLALATLERHAGGQEPAAIIMFTDGDGPLSQEACDAVMESGVLLYLMRTTPAQTPNAQLLVQLAEATGGADLYTSHIGGDSNFAAESQAGVSANSVTESQTSAVRTETRPDTAQGKERIELTFGENLPPDGFGEDGNVWRITVCTITYVLYAVLVSVVYYRRITLAGLAGSLCTGCLTACAITIDQRLCIPATVVLLLGAYTIYQVKEETAHV